MNLTIEKIIAMTTVLFFLTPALASLGSDPERLSVEARAKLFEDAVPEVPGDHGDNIEPARGVYHRPPREGRIIDSYLERMMREAEPDEKLELIVQFVDEIEASDLAYMRDLGVEVEHILDSFETVYCIATPEQIGVLKEYPRIFYMEYNEALTYYMDMSLETIKATDALYSVMLTENGERAPAVDGSGVTVVVLDTGIDAGHPDLDYKEKTIMNLKSDTDLVWVEAENTDTSSGHGTHCAGTVAGNGDASGGARRGVAPGARLIGLSTGDAMAILNALGGLQWVYRHSRPHNNPYNIRVVSNSWGAGGGEYDPKDSISVAINKLTYENNVVSVFAAGNSGGDGSDIQSSNYGNTPSAICVAAAERDGSGISDFSSRGNFGSNSTYPDIAAPGVKIWSTAARRTLISVMTKTGAQEIDPYYFPISGTSMATPHIAGVVALLWQAAPSLRVSYLSDHYSGEDEDWETRKDTKMHEAEVILKATADYINAPVDKGIPDNNTLGYFGKYYDIAQGYGLTNVRKAVGLAKTLQELRTRDFNNDGMPDHPNASVFDALDQYGKIIDRKDLNYSTLRLKAGWKGEWTRFTNQSNSLDSLETDQSHFIYVPERSERMLLDLTYNTVTASEISIANIGVVIDVDMDGTIDWRQPITSGSLSGTKHSEIDLSGGELSSHRGRQWMFNIEGRGIDLTLLDLLQGSAYGEVKVEYDIGLEILLEELPKSGNRIGQISLQSSYTPLEPLFLGDGLETSGVTMNRFVYDLGEVRPLEEPRERNGGGGGIPYPFLWLLIVFVIVVLGVTLYLKRTGRLKLGKEDHDS